MITPMQHIDLNGITTSSSIPSESNSTPGEYERQNGVCFAENIHEIRQNICSGCLRLGICFLAGGSFGISIEKSRVFNPRHIRHQMVFTSFIMLKVFLSALVTGQVIMLILSLLPNTKITFNYTLDAFTGSLVDKGIIASTVGPFLLGSGMSISGSCPVMLSVQLGTWTPYAVVTFCGGLTGALLYGMVEHRLAVYLKPKVPYENYTLHRKLKVPFAYLAMPMVVTLMGGLAIFELNFPWKSELTEPNHPKSTIVTARAWNPSVSGFVIGCLQIIVVFGDGDMIGTSTAFVTIAAQWVVTKRLKDMFPGLAVYRCGLGNWWQVVYFAGATVGGGLSARSSNSYMSVNGVNPLAAFVGGFLMLVGARMAAGCTSKHGLCGMALLVWLSMVAIPMMFLGGIVSAFLLKVAGLLDDEARW